MVLFVCSLSSLALAEFSCHAFATVLDPYSLFPFTPFCFPVSSEEECRWAFGCCQATPRSYLYVGSSD